MWFGQVNRDGETAICGLVGVAGNIERKHVEAFNDLMLFNIPRGKDSTGIGSVDRDRGRKVKDTYLLKAPVHALELQEFKQYDRVVSQGKFCIIGHGRAATVGKINKGNAHPFEFDDLIGAHNGTIPWGGLKDIPDHEKFGTDSEALYNSISLRGVEETIKGMSQGAWALTWYDKTDHSINFLRNSQRPLCYALVNDGKTLMWSSENDILHAAASRAGRNIETEGNTWWLPEDVWYKFVIPEDPTDKFAPPIETPLKAKEVPVVQSGHNFQRGHYISTVGERTTGTSAVAGVGDGRPYASLKPAIVLNLDKYKAGKKTGTRTVIQGWNGRHLSQQEFQTRTGETCAYSDDVVLYDDVVAGKVKVVFINETQIIKEEYNTPMWHDWLAQGIQ